MKTWDKAFVVGLTALFLGVILGLLIGGEIATNAKAQIAKVQAPPTVDAAAVEARAESALSEVRTFYHNVKFLCSWYGFESGKITASGERYDPMRFTAAHRALPFDTFLILENTANGRLCVVRISDRGPGIKTRQLDVSLGVARELGMEREGLAIVKAWVVGRPTGEMVRGRPSEKD